MDQKTNKFSPELFQKLFYSKTNEKTVVANLLKERLLGQQFANALDIGAGPGDITAVIAEHSKNLTLVEANGFYEIALRKRFPSTKVIIEDVRKAQLDSTYDFILLNQVFYFFPAEEWLPICKNLQKKLTNNGELLIILNDHHVGDLQKVFRQNFDRLQPYLTWDYVPLDQFVLDLKRDATSLSVIPYSYKVNYESLEETLTALWAVFFGVQNQKVIESNHSRFLELAKSFHQNDGSYSISMDAKLISVK